MMHILLTGPRDVGKSTIISQIITNLHLPVWGFYTRKDTDTFEEGLGNPVYMYPADDLFHKSVENLVGYCNEQRAYAFPESFDRFAQTHLQKSPLRHLIVMDEIGSMESKATIFCDTILRILSGPIPVLAAVKDKDTEFLQQVRNHPNCQCFYITKENRDDLLQEVLTLIKSNWSEGFNI